MKFIVSSSYLLKQLQVLGSVINSSNTLPILDNFLFELDNKALTVSASDLETTMSATLEIESSSKGSVAVPAILDQCGKAGRSAGGDYAECAHAAGGRLQAAVRQFAPRARAA